MRDVLKAGATDDPVRPLFSPAGELSPEARGHLGLDANALLELYRNMVLIRRVDQEAVNLQRRGTAAPGRWGPSPAPGCPGPRGGRLVTGRPGRRQASRPRHEQQPCPAPPGPRPRTGRPRTPPWVASWRTAATAPER